MLELLGWHARWLTDYNNDSVFRGKPLKTRENLSASVRQRLLHQKMWAAFRKRLKQEHIPQTAQFKVQRDKDLRVGGLSGRCGR